MRKFKYKNYYREFPDRWNELTKPQLLFVAKLLSLQVSKTVFITAVLGKFLKLKKKVFLSIHPNDFVGLGMAVSYLLETSQLTFNKLPMLRLWWFVKFQGPQDVLTDCTFEQFFEYAETYFAKYLETSEEQYLNLLVGSLYRKPDTSFNTERVEHNAKLLSKLPKHIKDSVFLFYAGCRNFLIKKFPLTFSGSDDSGNQPDGLEFVRLLNMIAKSPAENASIRKLNLYEALVHIEREIETSQSKTA